MKKCPFCAEMIQEEAVVCRYCSRDLTPGATAPPASSASLPASGATQISPAVAFGVIVAAVLIFGGMAVTGVFKPSQPESANGRLVLPSAPFSAPPVVTKSEYDQLREGMSYADAIHVIGSSGEELSRSDMAGFSTVMYSWANSNGSNMNAMFQNGKLVTKAQLGLP